MSRGAARTETAEVIPAVVFTDAFFVQAQDVFHVLHRHFVFYFMGVREGFRIFDGLTVMYFQANWLRLKL